MRGWRLPLLLLLLLLMRLLLDWEWWPPLLRCWTPLGAWPFPDVLSPTPSCSAPSPPPSLAHSAHSRGVTAASGRARLRALQAESETWASRELPSLLSKGGPKGGPLGLLLGVQAGVMVWPLATVAVLGGFGEALDVQAGVAGWLLTAAAVLVEFGEGVGEIGCRLGVCDVEPLSLPLTVALSRLKRVGLEGGFCDAWSICASEGADIPGTDGEAAVPATNGVAAIPGTDGGAAVPPTIEGAAIPGADGGAALAGSAGVLDCCSTPPPFGAIGMQDWATCGSSWRAGMLTSWSEPPASPAGMQDCRSAPPPLIVACTGDEGCCCCCCCCSHAASEPLLLKGSPTRPWNTDTIGGSCRCCCCC
mmetsp:Transcript_9468/g.25526  ORF Transcript_9468/g.25526 Transcript_9468/m.25526 type:complete len:362 (-) Transcript_9468:104-1189(-)